MQNIVILGSTWSIWTQTLDVVRNFSDKFRVRALAVNKNIELLFKQIEEFNPERVVVFDEKSADKLKVMLVWMSGVEVLSGMAWLISLVDDNFVDIVMNSLVGAIWIEPTRYALKAGKIVALANKETIVCAWQEMMRLVREFWWQIRSVDSEHSAIWQCLRAWKRSEVRKVWLTCSGGPFRDGKLWSKEKLMSVTPEQALKHPTWKMGRKISIDSATLANKWLEVIEAMYLFDLNPDQIEVIVHPQSIVHSAVEFNDWSIVAELWATDMRRVISYALFGEDRPVNTLKKLNLFETNLTFEKPDRDRFPCLMLAEKAARLWQEACADFNNANEKAVQMFLDGEIWFYDIADMIKERII